MTHRSLLIPLLLSLAACGQPSPDQPVSPAVASSSAGVHPTSESIGNKRYVDSANAFSIATPADFTVHQDFRGSYLENGAWKAFAPHDSRGKPLLDMLLKGSNKVTAAELRIGSSDDPQALAHCLDVPDTAVSAKTETIQLAGTPFTHFQAADAGMGHFLQVQAFRTVRNQRCYAIDLLITGVNPQMFDPPRQPPFDRAAAEKKLEDLVQTFSFAR